MCLLAFRNRTAHRHLDSSDFHVTFTAIQKMVGIQVTRLPHPPIVHRLYYNDGRVLIVHLAYMRSSPSAQASWLKDSK